MPSRTVYTVLCDSAAQYGDTAALHQPEGPGPRPRYRSYSWKEYRGIVEEIAAGLRKLGIRKGDIVALDASTRAEFYLADLGIMTNGSISAALYDSYPDADLVRTIRNCDAKAVFVENPGILEKLRRAADPPLAVHWILLAGEARGAITLAELREMGRRAIQENPSFLPGITAEVNSLDHAILYLTSGATGEPKMALTTHAALIANMDMGPTVLKMGPEDSTLAFLPSAHITQRVVVELLPLRTGITVWFSGGLMRLQEEFQRIKPTLLIAPPRLWERIHSNIRNEIRKRSGWRQKVAFAAIGLALRALEFRERGEPVPGWMTAPLAAADRLIFRKIRHRLGGQPRVCGSGSAPLGKHLARFYTAIGLPMHEGFGLTEGGVVMLNPIGKPKPGSIGKPLPGIEARIARDGELIVRGPTLFSGYYKDPEATAQVVRNGWLHTGDTAEVDQDGYFYITGRKKEIIALSSGKKVYPARVEALFKSEPVISNIFLVGDRLPYITALITVNTQEAAAIAGMKSADGANVSELTHSDPVLEEVRRAVRRVNEQLADFEQVRKYRILDREFTIELGELTPTLKVRRSRVLENFREEVAALYARDDAPAPNGGPRNG